MKWPTHFWQEIHATKPADVANAVFGVAGQGDWEGIQNAKVAGVFSSGVDRLMLARRMAGAFSILDHASSSSSKFASILSDLQEWLNNVNPSIKNRTLYEAVRAPAFLPRACQALIDAGADPYVHEAGDDCLNSLLVRSNLDEELAMMKVLYGDGPISHPNQLPERFSFGDSDHNNLLQLCARIHRFDLVNWLHGRLVPESDAMNILLEMGDKVLQHLWLDASGASALNAGMGPPGDGTEVTNALVYIAAGAQFRDPAMWHRVARTRVRAEEECEKPVTLIDWVMSHSYPMIASSDARLRRRVRTLPILHAFFKHGAISVDERLEDGRTLLMCAARQGEHSWVAYLLEKGADPLLTTDGKTASQLAIEGAQPESSQMIEAFVAKRAISRVLEQSRAARDATPRSLQHRYF